MSLGFFCCCLFLKIPVTSLNMYWKSDDPISHELFAVAGQNIFFYI